MKKKICVVGHNVKQIRDTSEALPRINADRIAEALAAQCGCESLEEVLAPITLQAVREELYRRLQSSGAAAEKK